MLDIHGLGLPGERTASTPRKPVQPGVDFGAMLAAAKQDVRAALGQQALSAPAAGETIADRCRAVLELGAEASGDAFQTIYGKLIAATEAQYGHLPHDSLERILAMADYAENNRMED